jgi:hypothetical protein
MVTTTSVDPSPEPRKEKFTEKPLPAEPKSDVKLVMEGGLTLRERVNRIARGTSVSYVFTYTKLDDDGNVVNDDYGDPIIPPPHEVVLAGDAATRLGASGIKRELEAGRQVAAAQAVDHFNGLTMLPKLLADRLQ